MLLIAFTPIYSYTELTYHNELTFPDFINVDFLKEIDKAFRQYFNLPEIDYQVYIIDHFQLQILGYEIGVLNDTNPGSVLYGLTDYKAKVIVISQQVPYLTFIHELVHAYHVWGGSEEAARKVVDDHEVLTKYVKEILRLIPHDKVPENIHF